MESIYENNFLEYLESKLGTVKVTSRNFIVPCPFCEFGQKKDHYHLYIGLDAPIFHCFHAGCGAKGTIKKLIRKIEGYDISEKFVNKAKIKEFKFKKITQIKEEKKLYLPPIDVDKFKEKDFYIRKRLKFSNIRSIDVKNLVFDINKFIELNEIIVDEKLFRIREFLHNNFVGFLTEQNNLLVLRNIDEKSDFRYFKLKIRNSYFPDYYCLRGNNPQSNVVVLAEGIFDIYTEYIYDSTNSKDRCRLYATALSDNYSELLKSIVFNESIFRPEVIILSDRGLNRDYYRKFKNYNTHIIDRLIVYYNDNGKDFNNTPIVPIKILIE